MNREKNAAPYIIGMIVAMLLWGISWTTGKAAVEHANAEVAAFWRYAISFISMIPILWYLKIPMNTDRKGLYLMVGSGLLTALFNYLFFASLSHGDAGYGGTIVTSVSPGVTYVLSILIFGIRVSSLQLVALFVGLFGALILLRVPLEGWSFLNLGSAYFLGCAIVWAVVTILAQKAAERVDLMFYTFVVFGITGLSNMLFALPYPLFNLSAYDAVFWGNIIFMGLFPGTFATLLFFFATAKIGAHRSGVFMFIVPVGAMLSSYIIYDEPIVRSTVIGALLTFSAVMLFNMKIDIKLKREG